MASNRYTKWLERSNHNVCLRIAQTYYGKKERGLAVPYLRPSFLFAIIQRLFLVFLSLFRFKKELFSSYRNRSVRAVVKRLVGIHKFEILDMIPTPIEFSPFSVPSSDNPSVSIIVCVHNHIDFTYNCLLSILRNTQNISYEIIVVNDCSTDETKEVLGTIENLIVIENLENLGFLRSCNKAITRARGEYVCFLNNDTQVRPGWLEQLIAPFNQFGDVGLVGAKLLYPYGLLQEAGGIVNYHGQPSNYGKFDDPDHPYYGYLRQADYCSGACILIPKRYLDELNGFDEAFAPAYYEDTDLAFRIRYKLNKKVYYQPLAEIIHFEGVSSGKVSDGSNIKGYQQVNAKKFMDRWGEVFKTFPQTTEPLQVARKFIQAPKTVAIIDSLLPTFDQDSGSRRMFEIVKMMLRLGIEVIYMPQARPKQEPYYSMLVNMGVLVVVIPKYEKTTRRLLRLLAPIIDIAWICRPDNNRKHGRLAKQLGLHWLNDTVDLHFLREERAASIQGMRKKGLRRIKHRKNRELLLMRQSDLVIAITTSEADVLRQHQINHSTVVPNVHFAADGPHPDFNKRDGLCFIGGYRHPPNVDAAVWLVEEVMPLVWSKRPDIKINLLGSMPPPKVNELKAKMVNVPGYIPDVSSYFRSSKIFVAPLRYGAGMKGKIGQSFEYGLPVITTSIGAEGMDLLDGHHYIHAESASDFAQAILKLYDDERLWTKLSKGASEAIQPYIPERIMEKLDHILSENS